MNGFKSNIAVAVLALLCLVAVSISREEQQDTGRVVTVIPKAPSDGGRTLPVARGAVRQAPAATAGPAHAEAVQAVLEELTPDERAALEKLLSTNRKAITEEMLQDPAWVSRMVEQYVREPKPPESPAPDAIQGENPYERLVREGLPQHPENHEDDADDENNPYSRLLRHGGPSPAS